MSNFRNPEENEFFRDADKIQHKPLTDAQWSDAVECYQRAKLMTDAVSDLVKAFAEQTGKTTTQIRKVIKARADCKESEMRDELQGTLELLGGE
jgi:hypothetical protein